MVLPRENLWSCLDQWPLPSVFFCAWRNLGGSGSASRHEAKAKAPRFDEGGRIAVRHLQLTRALTPIFKGTLTAKRFGSLAKSTTVSSSLSLAWPLAKIRSARTNGSKYSRKVLVGRNEVEVYHFLSAPRAQGEHLEPEGDGPLLSIT